MKLVLINCRRLQIAVLVTICVFAAGTPAYSAEAHQVNLPPPKLLKTTTGIEVEVLFAASGNIGVNQKNTDTPKNALFALASLPVGAVMGLLNPIYAFAPVVGIAMVPAGYALKQRVGTVTRTLDPALFSTAIVEAMREGIPAESDIGPGTRYSFFVHSFGLVPGDDGAPEVFASDREVCLFVKGKLRISLVDGAIQETPFNLTRVDRINGVPPPICRPFDRFTDDEGALLRDALTESASIIGAWSALQRLRE